MKKWLDRYESGGLVSKNSLNRNVTCSNCGWSWKLSDGGLDPMTCHKCGGDIKMREGGELDEYEDRGEVLSPAQQVALANSLAKNPKRITTPAPTVPAISQGYAPTPYSEALRNQRNNEYARNKAMQNSDLAKTFASFTPGGDNVDAGVIGAETFANLNPVMSGPILSASRLAPAILHPTNNAYWGADRSIGENALGALGALGDVTMLSPYFKGTLPKIPRGLPRVLSEGQAYEGAPHIYEDMVPINGRYQPRTVITDAGVKDEILGLEATPVIPLNQIEYPVTSNKFLYGPHNSFGKMEQGVVTDTYRGMPPGTNTYTSTLPSYASFPNNNIVQSWVAQELPGLHINSTLTGSPLEKQLSKTGDININSIKSYIGKADIGQQDKFIIDKVLNEKFSGATKINYNDFRKAVSEELVPLERNIINNYEHNNWGLGKLGYPSAKKSSFDAAIKNSKQEIDRLENLLKDKGNIEPTSWETSDQIRQRLQLQLDDIKTQYAKSIAEYENLPLENSSITYSNQSKFGKGSADHFDESTLGHARTLVSKEEPDVMHILEQQSDYWQKGGKQKQFDLERYKEVLARHETNYLNDLKVLKKLKETKKDYAGNTKSDYEIQQFEDIINKKGAELQLRKGDIANPIQKEFLGKNYQERLLQENVAYAAEQGKSKMRYPTSETAAKIQGYTKKVVGATEDWGGPMSNQGSVLTDYSSENKTILKKYEDTPKMIKKVLGVEPKVVTDPKGNTWYEFDIPDAAKKGKFEIKAFKNGGPIVTNRGQWDYPGQTTIIPSNKITMTGVNYPVLGVDNTGHTKMMHPGNDYTFPGQYVTEYPMAQNGKEVKKSSNILSRKNVSGDALTSTLKREAVAAFPYLQGIGKSIEKGISYITPDYKSQEDRELLFRRHRPVAYPSLSSGLADVVRDYSSRIFNTEIQKPFRDKDGDYEASEEAWRMTLGLPVKSKYIIPSAYRPLNETNKESKYYTLNENMYNKDLLRKKVEELKLKPGQSANLNSFAPFINENYMNKDEFSQVDPLQNFQIGVNKNGKMYFYDKYDFDFEPATKVVKPYEYEFYNEFKTGGEMIKRADGSYSKRGLWDNIRDNRGSGKAPTKQMLDQERKIRNQYKDGGEKDKFNTNLKGNAIEGFNYHSKLFPSLLNDSFDYDTKGFYKQIYNEYNGDLDAITKALTPNSPTQHIGTDRYKKPNHPTFSNESKYAIPIIRPGGKWGHNEEEDYDYFKATRRNIKNMNNSDGSPFNYFKRAEDYNQDGIPDVKLFFRNEPVFKQGGGVTLNAGGEQHRIYVKSTNRGEGDKGHIMVNHPTMDKGMWDTIDLTQKAGATTIAQGVAATKEWHMENPYMKQRGGEQNNNLKNINLNLPVIRHQEMNPLHFNGFLANDKNQNLFIGGVNPRYQNEDFSVGPYMIGVGNKYFQKFPADMGMSGTYHVNDNFDINMGAGQNNVNAGIKYNFANGGYVVRRSHDRKGKTHVVTGPDGTKKYFGDPNMGERGNSKYGKEAFYARHKSNLAKNPYFRAYARATWEEGGETMAIGGQNVMNPVTRKDNRNWLEFLKN
jgi:hypothetical protein